MNDNSLLRLQVRDVNEYDDHVHELLERLIKAPGATTRNDEGTKKIGATCISFNLLAMYPSIPFSTLRKFNPLNALAEQIGFLRGFTNVEDFRQLGTKVWDANAAKPAWKSNALALNAGDLGPIYGKQWRRWEDIKVTTADLFSLGYTPMGNLTPIPKEIADGISLITDYEGERKKVWRREIDQLRQAFDRLNSGNVNDRRAVVTSWNPGELDFMALPPCHILMQFTTLPYDQFKYQVHRDAVRAFDLDYGDDLREKAHAAATAAGVEGCDVDVDLPDYAERGFCGHIQPKFALNLCVYQRSQDTLLGRGFNIAAYAMTLRLFAKLLGMAPGNLEYFVADQHLYSNHVKAAEEVLDRNPLDADQEGEQLFQLQFKGMDKFEDIDTMTLDNIDLTNVKMHPKLDSDTKMTV